MSRPSLATVRCHRKARQDRQPRREPRAEDRQRLPRGPTL